MVLSLFQFRSRRSAWVFGISLFLLAAWLAISFYNVNRLPTTNHLLGRRGSSLFQSAKSIEEEKLAAQVREDIERQRKLIAKKEESLNELLKDVHVKTGSTVARDFSVVWDEPTQGYKIVSDSLQTRAQEESSEYTLLIIVLSSLENFEHRQVLRDRWKAVVAKQSNDELKQEIKIVFVLGDPRLGPDAGRHRGKRTQRDDDDGDNKAKVTYEDDEEPPQRADEEEEEEQEEDYDKERVRAYPGYIKETCDKLRTEQAAHNDLLFVRDVADSYYMLGERMKAIITLLSGDKNTIYEWDNNEAQDKTISSTNDDAEGVNVALTSVDRYSLYGFSYMMKVDDDSYVKLDRILDLLATLPKTAVYWGGFLKKAKVILSPATQWYNPEYAELTESYPAYAAGGAYILSRDLVEWLGRAPIPFKVWKGGPEDAQIGTWLAGLDIERVEANGAIWTKRCATCECNSTSVVAIHGFVPVHLQSCFSAEDNEHDICKCIYIQARLQEVQQNSRARSTSRGTVIRPSVNRYDTKRSQGTPIWLLMLVSFVSFIGCGVLGGFCIFLFCRLRIEVKKLKRLERGEDVSDEDELGSSDEEGGAYGFDPYEKDSGSSGDDDDDDDEDDDY